MTITLTANTPLAEALSSAVQPKLVEMGWSVEGEESSPLSEYIVLMLVNGKTEDQINAELTGDLLGLGPGDENAKNFTRWLFEELERLAQVHGGGSSANNWGNQGQPDSNIAVRSEVNGGSNRGDDEMQDAGGQQVDGIPTGPRAMRHNNNGNNIGNNNNNNNGNLRGRRPGGIFNQLNKAMERPPNDPLRRVRPQGDSTRIMKYDRNGRPIMGGGSPGPHQHNRNMQGQQRMQQHVQNAFGMPPMGGAGAQQNMQNPNGPPNSFTPVMMTPEQQMQFFQMMEQQARMLGMPGFMPPGMMGQQGFPNGQQAGAFGPPSGMQGGVGQGRSMFERVQMPHGQQNHRGNGGAKAADDDSTDATSQAESKKEEDGEETSKDQVACKFALGCTKVDCPFAHPSPVSDPTRASSFVPGEKCSFGVNCKNRKCTQSHPSPAASPNAPAAAAAPKNAAAALDCKYYPNCTNPVCPYRHPVVMPPCRNGPSCTRPGCHFNHDAVEVPCRFRPCLNPSCIFKHEEGQQGSFDNKVWTADGTGKPHVSDRKFVTDDNGQAEELIIPGGEHSQGNGDSDLLHVEHDMDL